jgi:hypothetical protein
MQFAKHEPVVTVLGALSGIVAAGLSAAVALGVLHWTPEQVAAVVALVAALLAPAAMILRSRVVPLQTHEADVERALQTPVEEVAGPPLDI